MDILPFLNSLDTEQQVDFATRCSTTVGYIRKAISTGQKFGAELCVRFERESGFLVTRKELRPEDWFAIWPELSDDYLRSKAA